MQQMPPRGSSSPGCRWGRYSLLDNRHVEFPAHAVSPAAPDEGPSGQHIRSKRYRHEQCRVGQHGRPPSDAQDLVYREVPHRQDCRRRERCQDRKREDSLEHGRGLGLWAVKWGVVRLGGELAFSNNEPQGTVVTVDLPTGVEAEPAALPHATAADEAEAD